MRQCGAPYRQPGADRYQSARGLLRDLERCQNEWADNGTIERFTLGVHDYVMKNGFDTVVPLFTEPAMARKFPASYMDMGGTFAKVVEELKSHLRIPVGATP